MKTKLHTHFYKVLLLSVLIMTASLPTSAYDFTIGDLCYNINSDSTSVTLTRCTYYSSLNGEIIIIPNHINCDGKQYIVTAIGDNAFYQTGRLKISIPNTVKRIGDFAFAKSSNYSIILGDSVESIGMGAFNQCELQEIIIPKSVKYIGDSALLNTPYLRTIIVEEENPVYDSRDNCNALIKTANNTLIAGSANTFIPETVTDIENLAFYLKRIEHIDIPSSLKRIGHMAFAGTALKTLNLPLIGPVYGEGCFAMCDITNVVIPDGWKSIGGTIGMFECCTHLQEVVIPNTVETINEMAFKDTKLSKVIIPNSVKTICDYAFYQTISSFDELTIGSGVEQIGEEAFHQLVIGEHNLNKITCLAVNPPVITNENCFQSSYTRATLYVPESSIEKYNTAYGWKNFLQIFPIQESAINEITADPAVEGKRQRYNLMGQPVGDDYHGIVIENGKKVLVK